MLEPTPGEEGPVPEGRGQPKKGRFGLKDFSYDAAADAYTCPARELLRPMPGRWVRSASVRCWERTLCPST